MTTPNPPAQESTGGGSAFSRKIGPLPMWGWMGVVLAVGLAYYFYKKSKSNTAATPTGTGGTSTVNSPGGVDASLVPQFVNQTYVQGTPPPAPDVNNITVNPPPTSLPNPTPAAPEPNTISGAPGSYTTGLGTGFNEWTSTGKYSLATIAKSHGMTAQQLIAASEAQTNNPALKAYVAKGNLNAPVPAGVALFIPSANWKTV